MAKAKTKTKTVVTVISKISERPVTRNAALVVIYGLDLGRKYDLDKEQLIIGRSANADIVIDQESISRSHAKVECEGDLVCLVDLKSTNGTFVNDEQISGKYVLRNGDLVKIGRTIFKFLAGGNIEAAYHDEIYRLTTIDGLTQIFNRRYFEDALDREISRANRYRRDLSLVMFDLDHFKLVNDRCGHLAGDHVLKGVASVIKARIRREDVFARYGGEEFALLLPEVAGRGAQQLAEKARRLIEDHAFEFDGEVLKITISAGVATLRAGHDAGELVRVADSRLYAAKQAGRNQVRA